MQSKCAVCGIKKSRFLKQQKKQGWLSNLRIKTPLNRIPLPRDILFLMQFHWMQFHWVYKNEWYCEQNVCLK